MRPWDHACGFLLVVDHGTGQSNRQDLVVGDRDSGRDGISHRLQLRE